MTGTAPPRSPRPSEPVDREVEALVEALIEEARQRARRRRRMYAAGVAVVALVGVAVFTAFEGTVAAGQNASPSLSARSSIPTTANSKLAFASLGPRGNALYVVNADGSGKRRLTGHSWLLTPSWSADGRKIAFWSGRDGLLREVYVVNADEAGGGA